MERPSPSRPNCRRCRIASPSWAGRPRAGRRLRPLTPRPAGGFPRPRAGSAQGAAERSGRRRGAPPGCRRSRPRPGCSVRRRCAWITIRIDCAGERRSVATAARYPGRPDRARRAGLRPDQGPGRRLVLDPDLEPVRGAARAVGEHVAERQFARRRPGARSARAPHRRHARRGRRSSGSRRPGRRSRTRTGRRAPSGWIRLPLIGRRRRVRPRRTGRWRAPCRSRPG